MIRLIGSFCAFIGSYGVFAYMFPVSQTVALTYQTHTASYALILAIITGILTFRAMK